ncbi:MAG: HD-like signal output (HDOD) protein [Candidatus Krumholzibacteriia bacterium]
MLSIFKKKQCDTSEAMQELLAGFELQSFPGLIMEVLSDLRDPNHSLGDIARKLEGDPNMTIKILRTVNAAGFGLSKEATSIQGAVSMMGRVKLETTLLTHAIKGALPFAKAPNFSMKQFWVSASLRACLARGIAQKLHPATQIESFTAGLLQDMAVPVLIRQRQEAYLEILSTMQNGTHCLHELENVQFNFDHTDVGGHMAREWNLPKYLTDAISFHHHENDSGGAELEPGVRLASLIRDDTGEVSLTPLFELAKSEYDLDKKIMTSILNEAFTDADQFARQMG